MPTYRLLVEYDGSKFAGWQIQPRGRTVQGVLLEALRQLTGEQRLDLAGAGRTDAGVHALGQVASFRTSTPLDPVRALPALQALLPADVAVRRWDLAAPGFHARRDATARAYRYQVALRRSAFGKRTSWWVPEPLSLPAMEEASRAFLGLHDYAAFTRRAKEQRSTRVFVEAAQLQQVDEVLLFRFIASHFLWNQVRRMVGVLVAVGRGELSPGDVPELIAGRRPLPPVGAPAAGLFLEAVRYPGEEFSLPPLLPVGLPLWRWPSPPAPGPC